MSGSVGDNVFRASGVIAAAAAGRTGTVDWDTTPKTGTVTAVSANGYFVNTTSGGITVNLPAASAGDIVALIGLKNTRTGDTLAQEDKPIILERIEFPEPVISIAVEAKTKDSQDSLAKGLAKLSEEDPTFIIKSDGDDYIMGGDYQVKKTGTKKYKIVDKK